MKKNMIFATLIYEWMRQEGLNNNQAALLLGISERTLKKWKNGSTFPDNYNQKKVAETLGIDIKDLGFNPDNNGLVIKEKKPLAIIPEKELGVVIVPNGLYCEHEEAIIDGAFAESRDAEVRRTGHILSNKKIRALFILLIILAAPIAMAMIWWINIRLDAAPLILKGLFVYFISAILFFVCWYQREKGETKSKILLIEQIVSGAFQVCGLTMFGLAFGNMVM